MSAQFEAIYGQGIYGGAAGDDLREEWRARCLNAIPPEHKTPDNLDLLERLITLLAEELADTDYLLNRFDTFFIPETTPEEFLFWIIKEFFGWVLIPEGYPIARSRRLLKNLAVHYIRRYALRGVQGILSEFGIFNEVYDRPPFVGGFYGSRGSRHPLNVRVIVQGYEALIKPQRVTVGNFWGGTWAYTTPQIITKDFVMALIRWSRAAGVKFLVEWRVNNVKPQNVQIIGDDDEVTFP